MQVFHKNIWESIIQKSILLLSGKFLKVSSRYLFSTRRLAIANRPHVSIQGRPCKRVKIFLTSSLITVQNLVVVSHTVRACGRSQNLGDAGAPLPLGRGRGCP